MGNTSRVGTGVAHQRTCCRTRGHTRLADSDSNYSERRQALQRYSDGGADHDEERAARNIHLLLSAIPTPACQDIVMDRLPHLPEQPGTWNSKVLRSIYTN
jgi:hypothetical protein